MSLQPGEIGGGVVKAAVERKASAIPATDPERWVDEHGDILYRYAL